MIKKCLQAVIPAIVILTMVHSSAFAANYNWTGAADRNWFNGANWSRTAAYTNPCPRAGDNMRLGVANTTPAVNTNNWPRYNGETGTNVETATTGAFLIGQITNASFYMESGFLGHLSWVNVGNGAGFQGTWVQTGGTFNSWDPVGGASGRQFSVGGSVGAAGFLTLSGGILRVGDFGVCRSINSPYPASYSWALIEGTGQLQAGGMQVGMAGDGLGCMTNRGSGVITIQGTISMGRWEYAGSNSTFAIESGSVTADNLNYNTPNTVLLSGGELAVNYMDSTNTGSFTSGFGTFIFDGGTLRSRGGSQRLIRDVGTVTVNAGKQALIDTDGNYTRILNPISGSGGLTKLGLGTMDLERLNTYAGPTLVSQGSLVFADVASTMGSVGVASGAGFGARIPASVGKLTLSSLTYSNGASSLDMTIGPGDAGSTDPRIQVASLQLNGTVSVNIAVTDALTPGTYPLLKWTTKTGSGSFIEGTSPCSADISLAVVGNQLNLTVNSLITAGIAQDPVDQTVLQNRPVSFSAAAQCLESVSYQWLFNEAPITDATNTTYSIDLAQLTDAGAYKFVAINPNGSVTSAPAVLTVTADLVGPKIVSATCYTNKGTVVYAYFDELLDGATPLNAANYLLTNRTSGGAAVAPVSVTLTNGTIALTFPSSLDLGRVYALSAPGVTDLAGNFSAGSALVKVYGAPVPSADANRLTVVEAESADILQSSDLYGTGYTNMWYWDITAERAGYSGSSAIRALPNIGHSGNPIWEGPGARYFIDFPASDTYPASYYLWVRGGASSGADDSINASVDWAWPAILNHRTMVTNIAQNFYQPSGGWGWSGRSEQLGLPRSILVISNAGIHSVDILMREDGCYVDKFVLTTDSAYDPSAVNGGLGPDETRASYPPTIAILPGSLSYSGTTFSMQVQTVPTVENIIEYKNSLDDPSWTLLTSFVGNGAIQTKSDPAASGNARFYRARIVVP